MLHLLLRVLSHHIDFSFAFIMQLQMRYCLLCHTITIFFIVIWTCGVQAPFFFFFSIQLAEPL